jgi:dihydrolipoamide dehydrogenase
VKGHGRFKGANEIEVDLVDGGKQTIKTKRTLIATGSEVTPFPGGAVQVRGCAVRWRSALMCA